jgi:hypothetical protein
MLTGGVDVDPALYGASDRHPTVEVDPERDTYEFSLTRLALDRDMPLLAICRGAQVVNVVAGGTLIQDIPSARTGALEHQQSGAKDQPSHPVRVVAGTCLSHLFPESAHERTWTRCEQPAPSVSRSACARIHRVRDRARWNYRSLRTSGVAFLHRRAVAPGKLLAVGIVQGALRCLVAAARRYREGRSDTKDTTTSM